MRKRKSYNISERQGQWQAFGSYEEAAMRYALGRNTIINMAKEAGALIKIGKSARVDYERMDAHIRMLSDFDEQKALQFPLNLYEKILGKGCDIPHDWESTLEYIMRDFTEIQIAAINGVYKDFASCADIADEKGVSRQHVHHCLRKAEDKLKSPTKRRLMADGLEIYNLKKEKERELAKEKAEIAKKAIMKAYEEKMTSLSISPISEDIKNMEIPIPFMPLGEMGLTVRSYNCCRRAKIDKVGDFIGLELSELARIRNMGIKSQTEITNKLIEMGFEIINDVISYPLRQA